MATITITAKVLDGNLGEGWRDNSEVADALAEYMKTVWEQDLKKFADQGHTIEFDISVQYRTSGFSGSVGVLIDDDEEESLSEREIDLSLTAEEIIWENFCRANIGTELSEN